MCRDREKNFSTRCLEAGLGIALGSSFATEELGWFRISFAVEEQALNAGLYRLIQCLEAMDAEDYEI
jgi:bifunctional pyridoxal-dependent enzyme with beta-cystathionase and maltose regulon repressor activities